MGYPPPIAILNNAGNEAAITVTQEPPLDNVFRLYFFMLSPVPAAR